MIQISKFLSALLLSPLWAISGVWPKDRDLWVFGAWYGQQFSDNSRAVYEYALQAASGKTIVWLTSNRSVHDSMRANGYRVELAYSFRGMFVSLRAGVAVVSSGMVDVNRFLCNAPVKIMLWHGVPLKKIGDQTRKGLVQLMYSLARRIAPTIDPPYSTLVSTSDSVAKVMLEAYPRALQVSTTGYPRNDVLVSQTNNMSDEILILYMPTFRQYPGFSIDDYFQTFDPSAAQDMLKSIGAKLILKLHPSMHDLQLNLDAFSQIEIAPSRSDAQTLLAKSNCLITDYSGAYIDYLLLDRPVVFFAFDLEQYLASDRGLNFNFQKVAPGPICDDWNQVLEASHEAITNPNQFGEHRQETKHFFHEHCDAHSSRRVYETILNIQSKAH